MKVSNAQGLGHEKDWISEERKATAAGVGEGEKGGVTHTGVRDTGGPDHRGPYMSCIVHIVSFLPNIRPSSLHSESVYTSSCSTWYHPLVPEAHMSYNTVTGFLSPPY